MVKMRRRGVGKMCISRTYFGPLEGLQPRSDVHAHALLSPELSASDARLMIG